MKFQDALRKVISESEERRSLISERSSYSYSYLSDFLDGKRKLYDSEMERLYYALNEGDREKWRSLIASQDS